MINLINLSMLITYITNTVFCCESCEQDNFLQGLNRSLINANINNVKVINSQDSSLVLANENNIRKIIICGVVFAIFVCAAIVFKFRNKLRVGIKKIIN